MLAVALALYVTQTGGSSVADWQRLMAEKGYMMVVPKGELEWKELKELRAENERLRAAIRYVRDRSARACEILNEFDYSIQPRSQR